MGNKKERKILCVITARGGSVRVPRKNLKLLGGEPLIAHSIRSALGVSAISRLIVSTDDEEIMTIAKHYGAEVPFKRPAYLAESDSPSYKVLQHALEYMRDNEGFHADILILIQPTSPFVSAEDISACLHVYEDSLKFDIVVSAYKAESNYIFYVDDNGFFQPVRSERSPLHTEEKYVIAGSVYIYDANIVPHLKDSLTEKTGFCLVEKMRAIDIDTEADFVVAEKMIDGKKAKLEC
jgi:CMP-N,N'-diacetyllegionaminic acid synthase